MKLLEGKTALVTGGSRGIGLAVATKFAENGANVAFTFISSEAKAKEVEEQLKSHGVEAKAYKSDASSFEAAETLINEVVEQFGQIDVIVNNAGITRDNLILRMDEEQWNKVIETNLNSVFNVSKNAARTLLKQRAGSIINLTSIVGMRGQAGQSNYAASKAGIIGFTKSLADELGSRGIRVNAIAPGFIETDMTAELPEETRKAYLSQIPMKRLGEASEVADVALFLGCDLSKYVSGQVISVCGALNR